MSEETTQPSSETAEVTTEATTVDGDGQAQSETLYLDGKYNSVSALENGYRELQSAFSKKTAEYNDNIKNYAQTQAPEQYELAEGIESNDKIEKLMEFAREHNVSNEFLNELIGFDNNYYEEITNQYIQSQKELLGKDADTRLKNVEDWAKAQFGVENLDNFRSMIGSAEQVKMMETIIKKMNGSSPVDMPSQQRLDEETINQMQYAVDAYGNPKMSDPKYAARVRAMRQQLIEQRNA